MIDYTSDSVKLTVSYFYSTISNFNPVLKIDVSVQNNVTDKL